MNRRGFLKTAALASAALALPALPAFAREEAPPVLWGDGVHDDTEAFQWYVDHARPIPRGRCYRLTRTIHVRAPGGVIMENCVITSSAPMAIYMDAGVA